MLYNRLVSIQSLNLTGVVRFHHVFLFMFHSLLKKMLELRHIQRNRLLLNVTIAFLFLIAYQLYHFTYLADYKITLRMTKHSPLTNQSIVWTRKKEEPLPTNHQFYGFNNQSGSSEYIVPNNVHYIRFNQTQFSFVEYICIRSAFINQNPDLIYFHTDVVNFSGKYWNQMVSEEELYAKIRIIPAELPSEIFGQTFRKNFRLFHGSDVKRIRLLMTHGGIYLDNDVFVVNNLDRYRKYEMVIPWDSFQPLGTQVLIAHKDARFLNFWLNSYRQYNPYKW